VSALHDPSPFTGILEHTMQLTIKTFLGAALTVAMTLGTQNAHAQSSRFDLLLKGGHVIDPANHLDGTFDVAVSGGKIAAVEKDIPESRAGKVVDVSGLFVTPGLVDIHTHIGHGGAPLNWFAPDARAHSEPLGIPADIALQSGVTTIVDAGSAGAETFLQEKEEVIDKAKVRVLAFLNIVGNGMNGGLEQTVDQMDVKQCAATIRKYPDVIVGVKTAHLTLQGARGVLKTARSFPQEVPCGENHLAGVSVASTRETRVL